MLYTKTIKGHDYWYFRTMVNYKDHWFYIGKVGKVNDHHISRLSHAISKYLTGSKSRKRKLPADAIDIKLYLKSILEKNRSV